MAKRILFLSWKDINHPASGGAELLTDVLASHLAKTHDVTYITSSYPLSPKVEHMHGYKVIRIGKTHTIYLYAYIWWHMQKAYRQGYDCIIDQVHGIPFFSIFYFRHPLVITVITEISGQLWNNIRSPLLRFIGKILEHVWLYAYAKHAIVTISKSTKDELVSHGVHAENISLLPMFSEIRPSSIPPKPLEPTLLVIGRIAPVKRIEDAIAAYQIAHRTISTLKLVIIGKTENAYEEYRSSLIEKITGDKNILFIENATEQEKLLWLARAHLLLMTSQKEGYGLVILEAAICGTPAIGYNVPGIQDAIVHSKTGLLAHKETPESLAASICEMVLDTARYADMQKAAFAHAAALTPEHTASAFENIVRDAI